VAATLVACFLVSGCDQGSPRDQSTRGSPLHVIAANIGADKKLPADGVVEIAFDRPLLPSSVTRQSVILREASGASVPPPIVAYNPVAKVVTIANPSPGGGSWLVVGQPYRVEFVRARDDTDGSGIRAIDRASLDPSETAQFVFSVSAATGNVPASVTFCADILPIFRAQCAGSTCHGDPPGVSGAAAGLVLGTSEGLTGTAIGRVARGANTGSRTAPRADGRVFGIDMAIVAPYAPASSWLLYKLLLADNIGAPDASSSSQCDGGAGTQTRVDPTPSVVSPWTPADRDALSVYVGGQEMPYPSFAATGEKLRDRALSVSDLERLRAWISAGALVEACAPCPL
jgi:hypothetical protein